MTSETLYVKNLPTPWLDVKKKRIYNAHDVFYEQTKNPLCGGTTVHKICMICNFGCADIILLRKWLTMDAGK